MSHYTPLDSGDTSYTVPSASAGKSNGQSQEATGEKSPVLAEGKSQNLPQGKSYKSMSGKSFESYGKSPELKYDNPSRRGHVKSIDKGDRKIPYTALEKLGNPSESAQTRGEIEQYHSTKLNASSRSDLKGADILDKITGLELEHDFPNIGLKNVKYGKQQKDFSSSSITPKLPHPLKVSKAGLKKGDETVHDRLYNACLMGDLRTVKDILRVHYTTLMPDEQGQTPLYAACIGNQPQIVDYLITQGYTVDHQDNDGKTPLHIAFEYEEPEIAKLLLQKYKANYKVRDHRNWTPLHSAVDHGYYDVCQTLSQNFLEADAGTDVSWIQLLAACIEKRLETVEFLLATNVDVNRVSSSGHTAVFLACVRNDSAIVKFLLQHKADPNLLNKHGHNCLQVALHRRNEDLVPLLLQAGADARATDGDGHNCLQLAIYKQCSAKTLKLLVEHGAPLEQRDNQDYTALLLASTISNFDSAVQLLLDAGCDPNVTDDDGDTALHNTVRAGFNAETVQSLIYHGARVNDINFKGHTVLMIVCVNGSMDILQLLLQKGADPNISDWDGNTPLLLACMKNDSAKVALLLKHGATFSYKNNVGHEPLGVAVRAKNTVVIEAFFNHNPTIVDMVMESGETALHCCCRRGRTDMIRWLLSHGVDKDKVCAKGTPLELALSHGHKNIVFMLLDAGADVSLSPDRLGFLAKIYPQRHRHMDILEYIVTGKNCKVDFTVRDAANETLFFKACRDGDVDLVQMLLDSKHDIGINICNKEGKTPVTIICANAGKPEKEALSLLSMIINSGRDVDVDKADHMRTTPLHLVCQEDNLFMVNLIVRKSRGSVNARDSMGRTPVQLAKTAEVINLLVNFGAKKD